MTFPERRGSKTDRNSKPIKQDSPEDNREPNPGYTAHMSENAASNYSKRRSRIPNRPNKPANLWSIMKNSIGKDLSRIPMPVNFSEPLSMLQRLTEDFEYSKLLDIAAVCKDPTEQLAYVAVFTISSYAGTAYRIAKPFNPLLGETFECDRRSDLGWRAISEQVSHHPPMCAQLCEGKKWTCWQEFTMSSKFRGKYITVIPLGTAHLKFDSGSHYTWRKVHTTVNNVIFGKMWIDNTGEMVITNHTDGSKCILQYIPYTQATLRAVEGQVKDKKGNVRWLIKGQWDSKAEITKVIESDNEQPPVTVWVVTAPPAGNDKFYNFTLLACQLNEPERGVAPTDSRNRPDQRLMEEGNWDEANRVKVILEDKQREVAKTCKENGERHEPVWFKPEKDTPTGETIHIYKGQYWEAKAKGDWSMCPDIFVCQG